MTTRLVISVEEESVEALGAAALSGPEARASFSCLVAPSHQKTQPIALSASLRARTEVHNHARAERKSWISLSKILQELGAPLRIA